MQLWQCPPHSRVKPESSSSPSVSHTPMLGKQWHYCIHTFNCLDAASAITASLILEQGGPSHFAPPPPPPQQNYSNHKFHLLWHKLQRARLTDAAQCFLSHRPVLDIADLVDEVSKNKVCRLARELGVLGQVTQQLQFQLQHLAKGRKKIIKIYIWRSTQVWRNHNYKTFKSSL